MVTEMPVLDITSANAILVLTVDELYPQGIRLQNFSTDQALNMSEITMAETRMGVDGNLVAGYIPSIKEVTVKLEATSPSYYALANLYRASEAKRGFYECTLTASLLQGLGKTFVWTAGLLVKGTPMPNIGKLLEPTSWLFQFSRFYIQG